MNFKVFFSIFFLLMISLLISAQNFNALSEQTEDAEDVKPDTNILIPTEFDNTLDDLLHTWIVQRSDSSDCRSSEIPENISDSIYKLRLSKMPCLMEMPYNNTVRSFIELYTVRKRRQVEYMMGMSDYYFRFLNRFWAPIICRSN